MPFPPSDPRHLLRDTDVRRNVAGALGAARSPAAVLELVSLLEDVEPRVRAASAESLAELAARGAVDASVLPAFATALEDPDAGVRAGAARALAELARRDTMSPRAIGPLVAALDDAQAATRRWAAVALGPHGRLSPSARRTVWAALSNKGLADEDGEVRKVSDEGLAALQEAPAIAVTDPVGELRQALSGLPVEETTERLVALGRGLRGPSLRRSSWELVARALTDPHAGEQLVRVLASATTREHALRALRLARAARVNRAPKGRVGGAAGGTREEVRPEREILIDDVEDEYGYYRESDYLYSSYEPSLSDRGAPDKLRVPGVLPVSALQVAVDQVTDRALSRPPAPPFTELRARTDPATYERLQRLVRGVSAPDPDTIALAGRLGVPERAADFAPGKRPVIRSPAELALLCLLEEYQDRSIQPDIDWAALTAGLIEEISSPPPPDGERLSGLLRAFLRAVLDAPRAHLMSLLRAAPAAHVDLAPVWLWAQLRAAEDITQATTRVHVAFGSELALHHVRASLGDLPLVRRVELPASGVRPQLLPELLLSGAGTLRRMDYPAFRLVLRPSISIVPRDLLEELVELTLNLVYKNQLLHDGTFDQIVTKLFEDAESTAYRRLPDAARRSLTRTLEEHAIAYVVLKTAVFADEPIKIRRRHLRAFAERKETLDEPPPASFAELRQQHGVDLAREGLCQALLCELHEPWTEDAALGGALKEGFIAVTRSIAATYRQGLVDPGTEVEEPAVRGFRLAQFLHARLVDAPIEIAAALGLGAGQGLPRLSGGRLPEPEQRYRRVMKRLSGAVRTVSGEERVIECRPLPKTEAIARSKLGADCSSTYVPFRALSPHHVYYGLFEGGEQRPGYMTVYEAWAELPDGKRAAVLCLETINVPKDAPDSALQDIARIFESIAAARGLHPGLVLITGIGTWNYQSGPLLEQSRRFRRGTPVTLHPADPVTWGLYAAVTYESWSYSAFNVARTGAFRLLAPFDPELDIVQPENEEEAARLRSAGERELIVTARSAEGPLGFISGWPDVL
jgi:hypothetical protein